ncbi:NADH:flavin oxidoreductase/NADH oxidase [Aspergillus clavatus NRRL 1]|uniref:NADH-dependent flavin oxidoreductase, putative n=1 Tax=Aspergillus clavatus (strain ATCC 1007 / CBS 513.65 / DSM 816 / NCTC 3887 / NRRL 1 / QM 1276 / 107) TaxID=344612 RepID=A1CDX7_ASPCL|nr:NADH-dependent flavin oxidoreductase, putative [Aspergillus clavatus NRRL 1]EAW12054.1 NADH-dependent flavin oxidoreductase, putative [Aspergillus clavatus NRRL 1]
MTVLDIDVPAAQGISYFTPAQDPPAGTAANPQTNGQKIPKLFRPLTIRGVTFQNRLGLAPLCQYSAQDGHMTDWHLAHLGGIAQRGPGMMIIEATAVQPEGRITPQDVGLWKDSQVEPMRRVIDFVHSQGQMIGVQIAHAGRKASTVAPWISFSAIATQKVGGWPDRVVGPSDIPFAPSFAQPKAMTLDQIEQFKKDWVSATKRAIAAGADFVEIHNAHGYLLSSFMSPAANNRTDQYGGSFENRIRLPLEIAQLTRDAVGPHVPVFLRISASDWCEETLPEQSWRSEDTVRFAQELVKQGAVDLIDISTGGVLAQQKVKSGPAFQVPFAVAVKKAVGEKLLVATVGAITNGQQATQILEEEDLDVALVGRGFQKDTGLAWTFAQHLNTEISMANQIRWGFTKRGGTPYIDPSVYKQSIFDF